jgi:protein-L-isoaspartate(D-aspartate) O-methyltransferase
MDNDYLVDKMVREGSLQSSEIIAAFRRVDRIHFVPENRRDEAYMDYPLPIGHGQTISQPTTVAIMTEKLEPKAGMKIVEIGAGSGYQAAILAEVVGSKGKVYTVERIDFLYEMAKENLKPYKNVRVILGDGSLGFREGAPFDRVIVTACAPGVPKPLVDQMKVNARMVLPVGKNLFWQKLLLVKKLKEKVETEEIGPFVFVPLIGEFGFEE